MEHVRRPSNSHGLAMRLMVWVVNSRSHDLAYSSHCESEIFKNLKIARQFQKESRNLKKIVFMDELYQSSFEGKRESNNPTSAHSRKT